MSNRVCDEDLNVACSILDDAVSEGSLNDSGVYECTELCNVLGEYDSRFDDDFGSKYTGLVLDGLVEEKLLYTDGNGQYAFSPIKSGNGIVDKVLNGGLKKGGLEKNVVNEDGDVIPISIHPNYVLGSGVDSRVDESESIILPFRKAA